MKRGFTLIELLAVIVILAVIMVIAVPLILSSIRIAKVTTYNNQMKTIDDAADKYMMLGFKYDNLTVGETITITLQDLYDTGVLKEAINPYTKQPFDATTEIYATKSIENTMEYTYEDQTDCKFTNRTCLKDNVTTDLIGKSQIYHGGTYYKGTDDQITNNYVWFSGQKYRIMGINSNGSIKLVTSLPVVSISWGPSGTVDYTNSYARKWLNILPAEHSLKDDYEGIFYKSLSRPELIEDYPFCIGKQDPTNSTDTTCSSTLTDKVGLMTWWEYKIAGPNANGNESYLDINDYLSFLTGDSRTTTNLLVSDGSTGSIYEVEDTTFASYPLNDYRTTVGLRPVINLKSGVSILRGSGTATNPYILVGDESGKANEYINSRYAGEYLNFAGSKYRIISKGVNGNTKILRDSYAISTGTSGGIDFTYYDKGLNSTDLCTNVTYCNNHFDVTDGSGDYNGELGHNIGYFLNSDASNSFWTILTPTYQAYLDNATYYFGKWEHGQDYIKTYTDTVTNGYGTQDLKVGMLQYGEMLAGNNDNSSTYVLSYWLINPYNSIEGSMQVGNQGYIYSRLPSERWYGVRPVLNLKPNIKIVSGEGTRTNPYEITN